MKGPSTKGPPLRIRLPIDNEEEFVVRYRSHLVRGGIFIATRTPKPVGTEFVFSLVLRDGTTILRGLGVVLKTRTDETSSHGMVVRFRQLDAAGQALVHRLKLDNNEVTQPGLPTEIEVDLEFTGEHPAPDAAFESAPLPQETAVAPPEEQAPSLPFPPEPDDPGKSTLPFGILAAEPPTVPGGESPLAQTAPESSPGHRPTVEGPLTDAVAPPFPLGLDPGVYQTRVAYVGPRGSELLELGPQGERYFPSAVAFPENGEPLFGWEALSTENPWYGWTRGVGLRANSPLAQRLFGEGPFALTADDEGNVAWEVAGVRHTAGELMAALLTQVKKVLSPALGSSQSVAVLCVPSHSGHRQRLALKAAAESAGFPIVRAIQGTSAAALAIGHGQSLPRRRVLVCDLGAGSTDAAVVEITGNDVESVSSVGDPEFGAIEVDHVLEDTLGMVHGMALEGLTRAKIALDTAETAELHTHNGSEPKQLTRGLLESAQAPYLERALALTHAVLQQAGLQAQGLDEVVLSGGHGHSTRIQQTWETALGKAPRKDLDAVALRARGAALLAHATSQTSSGSTTVSASELLTRFLEVRISGLGSQRLFEQGTPLPTEKTVDVKVEEGALIHIAVFQGSSIDIPDYVALATYAAERSGTLTLHFILDLSGLLTLTLTGPGQSPAQPLVLNLNETLPPDLEKLETPEHAASRPGLMQGLRRMLGRG